MKSFIRPLIWNVATLSVGLQLATGATLFHDDFSGLLSGTESLANRQASQGSWSVISGTPPNVVGAGAGGALDTKGGGRVFKANFNQAIGAGDVMQVSWTTLESEGTFAVGLAGFKLLLADNSEVGFVGSTSAGATFWELAKSVSSTSPNVASSGVLATNGNEAAEVKFSYAYDTGLAWLTVIGGVNKQDTRTATFNLGANLAIDSLRFENNSSGDFKFSKLSVTGPSDGIWKADSSGSWGLAANWSNGQIVGGSSALADFGNHNLTANRTVTMDGDRTVGHLIFGDIDSVGSGAVLTVAAGSGGTLSLDHGLEVPILQSNASSSNITAQLAGTRGFVKTGAGSLTLNNVANATTLSGQVRINQGLLGISDDRVLGAVPALFQSDAIVLNGGGLANMTNSTSGVLTQFSNGHSVTLQANRGITLGANGGTFRVGYHTANHHFAVNGVISGVGGLNKDDSANLVLRGANTYTGNTNVNSGSFYALNSSGSASGFGSFYLKGSTTTPTFLGGDGTIQSSAGKLIEVGQYGVLRVGSSHAGAVNGGGLSIDQAAKTLTLGKASGAEAVNVNLFGRLEFDLFGTSSDLLKIHSTGTVNANLVQLQLGIINTSGWAIGQEWQLIDWTGATHTSTSTLSDFSQEYAGFQLSGDVRADGFYLQIVPEPSRALLVGMAVGWVMLQRRRK